MSKEIDGDCRQGFKPTITGKALAKVALGPSLFILAALFFLFFLGFSQVEAASKDTRKNSESAVKPEKSSKKTRSRRSKKGEEKVEESEEEEEEAKEESIFLAESEESQKYVPDIFRCADCGYEQDEPGKCPDHERDPLVQVISMGKNPLEPPEVDGNEDILTDLPLTGLKFRKPRTIASPTKEIGKEKMTEK